MLLSSHFGAKSKPLKPFPVLALFGRGAELARRKSELLEQIAQKKAELQRKNAIVRSNSSLTLFLVQGCDRWQRAQQIPSTHAPWNW